MHYHPHYEQYLRNNPDGAGIYGMCYDGPIWELDPEDYIELEEKQYRREHPDRQWYKKFEKKRR